MITKDILWKGIIEDLFDDYLYYFHPTFAQTVDFNRQFEFLDKELDTLYPEAEAGKKYADKLVKVFTKKGNEHYILMHIEAQGYTDANFAQRMFTYFYRIRDRWRADVMAFVLYTGGDKNFHPKKYIYKFEDTSFVYKFKTFKLLDKTEQELDIPNNPFSIVMKVAYKALQKHLLGDKEQLIWKTELVRELYQAGYEKDKIRNILNFIRYYTAFDLNQNTVQLDNQIQQITKQRKNMGIEQAIKEAIKEQALAEGEAKGKAEGEAKGEAKGVKNTVFGIFTEGLSVEAIVRITKLPLDTIELWKKEWEQTLK